MRARYLVAIEIMCFFWPIGAEEGQVESVIQKSHSDSFFRSIIDINYFQNRRIINDEESVLPLSHYKGA